MASVGNMCTPTLTHSLVYTRTHRVDHWDLEKERIVVLSDNNLISIKYNFILSTVEELKYIPLSHIQELLFGDFKYTSSYVL